MPVRQEGYNLDGMTLDDTVEAATLIHANDFLRRHRLERRRHETKGYGLAASPSVPFKWVAQKFLPNILRPTEIAVCVHSMGVYYECAKSALFLARMGDPKRSDHAV